MYVVAGYQGRLSCRFVSSSSTTVYMDEELASFDTEEEARKYIEEFEDEYDKEYYKEYYKKMDDLYDDD